MPTYQPIQDVPGLAIIVRGWLHGNTVVLGGKVPSIMDTGYHTGADELLGLLADEAGLAGLAHIYLTHIHSDHAGGCATVRRRTGATIHAHADCRKLAEKWSPKALWLEGMGQQMDRFRVHRLLHPGDELETNKLTWQIHATGGHAVGGLSFYEPTHKVLVSGDALWEDGFGVLNVPLEGEQIYGFAAQALDTLAALDVSLVLPGHGPPFTDFAGALTRARQTLARWRDDPDQMLRHNLRGGLAFWLLAHDGAPRADLEGVVKTFLKASGLGRSRDKITEVINGLTRAGALDQREGNVFAGDRIKRVTP